MVGNPQPTSARHTQPLFSPFSGLPLGSWVSLNSWVQWSSRDLWCTIHRGGQPSISTSTWGQLYSSIWHLSSHHPLPSGRNVGVLCVLAKVNSQRNVGMRALFEWVWAWWRTETRERWAVDKVGAKADCLWVDGIDGKLSPSFLFVDPPVCLGSSAPGGGGGQKKSQLSPVRAPPTAPPAPNAPKKCPSILTRSRANHFLSPFLILSAPAAEMLDHVVFPRSRMDAWCGA